MAISLVNVGTFRESTTSPATGNLPASYTTGDLFIATICSREDSPTPVHNITTSGVAWTQIGSTRFLDLGTTGISVSNWYRFAESASETAPSVTCPTPNGLYCTIIALRGVDASDPLDSVTPIGGTNAAATTLKPNGATGITTNTDGAWVCSVAASADDNAHTLSVANGFTLQFGGAAHDSALGGTAALSFATILKTTAGNQQAPTHNQSLVGSDAWAWQLFVLKMNHPVPSAPTVNSPADAAVVTSLTPTLDFTGTVPDGHGATYLVEVATDSGFTTGLQQFYSTANPGFVNPDNGGDTEPFNSGENIQYTFQSALTDYTTYYYRVSCADVLGSGFSSPSATRSFTVQDHPTPSAPTLNSPADASTVGATPTLDFTATASDSDSLEYEVQISDNSGFSGAITSMVDSCTDASNNTDQIWARSAYDGGRYERFGQSFTGTGIAISRLILQMQREGDPPDDLVVQIFAHSGTFGTSSVPTGAALATSDPVDPAIIPPNGSATVPVNFTFSGANKITLVNGTRYVYSVGWTGLNATTADYVRTMSKTSGSHGGNYWRILCGNVTYEPVAGTDQLFEIGLAGVLLDKLSSVPDAGFVNPDTGGDTHPFNSGENIQYTVQVGDTLAAGTWYWRVRCRDASDSVTRWSNWSSTRSVTVTSGITAQTTSLVLTAVPGTVTSDQTITAQVATLTLTPIVGVKTGGPVSFAAQVGGLAFAPQAGILVLGAVTVTAQITNSTLSPVVGVVMAGPVAVAAQAATVTLTPLVGAVLVDQTVTAQVGTLTLTPLVGTVALTLIVNAQVGTISFAGVGTLIAGPVTVNVQIASLALTPVVGAPVADILQVAQVAILGVVPRAGVMTGGPTSFAAQTATYSITPQAGLIAGGAVTKAAQIATSTLSPVVGTLVAGPITVTAQVVTLTLTPLAGTVASVFAVNAQTVTLTLTPQVGTVSSVFTKTAQIATSTLTAVVGVIVLGPITVTAQVVTLVVTPLAGSTGGSVTQVAQIGSLAVVPQVGIVQTGPVTKTAQVATSTLTAVVGVVVLGPITVTAQVATCTITLSTSVLTPGAATQQAQVATLLVTPGSTAMGSGTLKPATVVTVALVGVPGVTIGGPASASGTTCPLTLVAVAGAVVLGGLTVSAATPVLALTANAGAPVVGAVTVNGTPRVLTFTPIAGTLTGQATITGSTASLALAGRMGQGVGGAATITRSVGVLSLISRAGDVQMGNQVWLGAHGFIALMGDEGEFDGSTLAFAGWGVPIA